MEVYEPSQQYRCTIIRGKAQTELDDLLPAYCKIIDAICPIDKNSFSEKFNSLLSRVIHNYTDKTLSNHRTEIAGKLFGLWYEKDNIIFASPKVTKLLESSDNPLFFKDLVIKLQFPNGMDKIQTIKERMKNKIKFRPTPYILAILKEAFKDNLKISKNNIAYYVLNNLQVLQGKISYQQVYDRIKNDKEHNLYFKVSTHGKASSYDMQHISEQINLIGLANLIRVEPEGIEKTIKLNPNELKTIDKIIDMYLNKIDINPYDYDFENTESVAQFYSDWTDYYCSVLTDSPVQATTTSNIFDNNEVYKDKEIKIEKSSLPILDPLTIGDEGESIVMEYEKQRVSIFNKRLVNKVIHFGKQRGLGYDVASIFASGRNPEHAIYIEVKTTKRVTEPKAVFTDQFDMTRNEWIAAEQYEDNFFIYRVYLFNKGVKIFKMDSPVKLKKQEKIFAEPLKYHIEFDNKIGEFINE